MLTQKLSFVSILATILMGCAPPIVGDTSPDLAHNADDMGAPIDQQPSQPSCPAAAGIPGDRLLCADFSKISTLADPSLGNWNFAVDSSAPACWQLIDGALANKNVDKIFNCAVSLPGLDLTDPALQRFSRFTFSIHYRLDLRDGQYGYIFLASNPPGSGTYLAYEPGETNGIHNIQKTRSFTLERAQLPSTLNNLFKPYISLSSRYQDIQSQGWQISSLAVIGSP